MAYLRRQVLYAPAPTLFRCMYSHVVSVPTVLVNKEYLHDKGRVISGEALPCMARLNVSPSNVPPYPVYTPRRNRVSG
jgi:hypothetical protein